MRILFFAHLKTAANCAATEIRIDRDIDADQLWQLLLARFPELTRHQRSVRFACNGTYAVAGTRFSDTDELALIPPVSGG